MLKYSLYTLLILTLVEYLAYYFYFYQDADFVSKYWLWIFYIIISTVSIGAALWHFKSFHCKVDCMLGMMIGMVFAMQTGMLFGFIIGANNGMFIGSTSAIILSIILGLYVGRCCGMVGILQALMSAIMGGAMGTMLGVMLSVDNILYFAPFYLLVNVIVMWCFSYLLYEDLLENNQNVKIQPISFSKFLIYSAIVTIVLSAFIMYGPKTGLASLI